MLGQQRWLPRAHPPGEASRWQQGSSDEHKASLSHCPSSAVCSRAVRARSEHRKGKEISDGEWECLLWEPGG